MKALLFCAALFQSCILRLVNGFTFVPTTTKNTNFPNARSLGKITNKLLSSNSEHVRGEEADRSCIPKIVVFDLDGCLWRPEMYKLLNFSIDGGSAPLTPSKYDDNTLLTQGGEPLSLLGNVRDVMWEPHLELGTQMAREFLPVPINPTGPGNLSRSSESMMMMMMMMKEAPVLF
jgi:hypothetical protein